MLFTLAVPLTLISIVPGGLDDLEEIAQEKKIAERESGLNEIREIVANTFAESEGAVTEEKPAILKKALKKIKKAAKLSLQNSKFRV